jgi:hypothetical protein
MKTWDQMTSCPFFNLFSIIMWKILIFINPFHLVQVPTKIKQEFQNTLIQDIIFFIFFSCQLLEINFLWTNIKQPVVNIKDTKILSVIFCLLSTQQFPYYETGNKFTSFNSYQFLSQAHFRRQISCMNSSILWDTITCSSVKANWCFRGTYHLHLQGWRTMQARNQHEAGSRQSKFQMWFKENYCFP